MTDLSEHGLDRLMREYADANAETREEERLAGLTILAIAVPDLIAEIRRLRGTT